MVSCLMGDSTALASAIVRCCHRGIEIPFYNRGQLSFLYELNDNQKVFFSAPTSFGKTSIVTEYILNSTDNLNNVVFIVPTNSLLEELFEKFTLYNSKLELNYNISTQGEAFLFYCFWKNSLPSKILH